MGEREERAFAGLADGLPLTSANQEGGEATASAAAPWTQADAIALCRDVEAICPAFGCHVALTGGCLYKDGERKDADLLFYRIRQVGEIDKPGLFQALEAIGVTELNGFGWVHKAEYRGRSIDFFFPEEDGEYPPREDSLSLLVDNNFNAAEVF